MKNKKKNPPDKGIILTTTNYRTRTVTIVTGDSGNNRIVSE